MISLVRDAFSVHLPLLVLYEANTVAALAVKIVAAQAEKANSAKLEQVLAELDQLSDQEAQFLTTRESDQEAGLG